MQFFLVCFVCCVCAVSHSHVTVARTLCTLCSVFGSAAPTCVVEPGGAHKRPVWRASLSVYTYVSSTLSSTRMSPLHICIFMLHIYLHTPCMLVYVYHVRYVYTPYGVYIPSLVYTRMLMLF